MRIQQKIESLGSLIYKIIGPHQSNRRAFLNRVQRAIRGIPWQGGPTGQQEVDGRRQRAEPQWSRCRLSHQGRPEYQRDTAWMPLKPTMKTASQALPLLTSRLIRHGSRQGLFERGIRRFRWSYRHSCWAHQCRWGIPEWWQPWLAKADNLDRLRHVSLGLQGKPSRYDLTLNDDGLTVVDKATGDIIQQWHGPKTNGG